MNLFTVIRSFDNLDHKAIAQWLGENNPELLLAAAQGTRQTGVAPSAPKWIADLQKIDKYGDGGPVYNHSNPYYVVPSIKHVREHTGLGLRDAKDVIDRLRGTMHSSIDMSDAAFDVFNRIVNAGVTSL